MSVARAMRALLLLTLALPLPAAAQEIPVGEQTQQARELLQNANRTLRNLDRLTKNLEQALDGRLEALLENLNQTSSNLESITTKIDQGRGTLGRMVNDEDFAESVGRMAKATGRLGVAAGTGAFLATRDSEVRTDIYVLLSLEAGEFFHLGASHRTQAVPGGPAFSVQAQVGKRLGPVGIRAGIFENAGGLGIEYYLPLPGSRISAEAYRFENTQLNAALHLQVQGPFLLWLGGDALSIRERRSFFIGGGLRVGVL
jgi:phospholipid/cholesterol/gamma-HCH transport system substrate-binding protein